MIKDSYQLEAFLKPLSAIQSLMRKAGCPWVIIGGVAAGLLGKPRFTADVDLVAVIEDKGIGKLLKACRQYGLNPRISQAYEFAKKNRVLLLKHRESGIHVDISLGILPFEKEAIKNSKKYKINDVTIYLPRPEDLIIFKSVANRPQDIIDIGEIIKRNPKINRAYLKKRIKEFARILEMPEIWDKVCELLNRDLRR
ncbi:MAG: hypothetical protein WC658_00470 [Candidatus Omnitrophota bacterium]